MKSIDKGKAPFRYLSAVTVISALLIMLNAYLGMRSELFSRVCRCPAHFCCLACHPDERLEEEPGHVLPFVCHCLQC